MSKDVNEMTAVLDRLPTPVTVKTTRRTAKLGSMMLPALAIAVPLLAPIAVAEGLINRPEMAQSVEPAVSAPAPPVASDRPTPPTALAASPAPSVPSPPSILSLIHI